MGIRMLRRAVVAGVVLYASPACAGRHHLADYDYRGAALAVVSTYPPYPEVLTGPYFPDHSRNPIHVIVKAGSRIAKEVEARRVRARLDTASRDVNVADRARDGIARRAARSLGARLVDEEEGADFLLEVRVRDYGIDAEDWEAAAHFFVEAQVELLDAASGRLIWKTRVRSRDPITPAIFGGRWHSVTRNVVTAAALADLSVEDLKRALEQLADYSADQVTRRLRNALEDSR
jgi:hypothetical protein